MDRYQLGDYLIKQNPYSGDFLLMVNGPIAYKHIISRAFPSFYFSRTFEDRDGRYDWGVYIKGAKEEGADRKKGWSITCTWNRCYQDSPRFIRGYLVL